MRATTSAGGGLLAAALAAATALLPAACSAPPDALVQRCTTPALSVVTTCELTADVLRQERSAFIDPKTSNPRVRVKARFTLRTGEVRVGLPCDGGRLTVTSERPAAFECDGAVDRGSGTLRIDATPASGGAEGLAGTLEFRPL